MKKSVLITILAGIVAVMISCGDDAKDSKTAQGAKGGACYKNGTCDSGLECYSNVCVDPDEHGVTDTGNEKNDYDYPNTTTDNEKSDNDVVLTGSCPSNNKFCHEHDGLFWSDKSERMTWEEAIAYCSDMGGRLPNINELRTLIINCPGTQTGGTCKASDPDCLSFDECWSEESCHCDGSAESYSALGDDKNTRLWSASELSDSSEHSWNVYFDNGDVDDIHKTSNTFLRCVRH